MLVVAVSFFAGGCARQEVEKPLQSTPSNPGLHGATPVGKGEGFVGVINNQFLANNTETSVGAAIDGYTYFTKKEWQESRNSRGTNYIDFTGWFVNSTVERCIPQFCSLFTRLRHQNLIHHLMTEDH